MKVLNRHAVSFALWVRFMKIHDIIMNSRWLLWVVVLLICLLVHGILGREISRQTDDGSDGKVEYHDMGLLLVRHKRQSNPVPNCGSALRSSHDIISSPRFPWKYEENLYCQWKIVVPLKNVIRVDFISFDITSSKFNLCDLNGDYLLIQDLDRSGPIIGFYCGSTLPAPLTSTTEEIWITFHTDRDSIGAGAGFQLSFTAIDPPRITTPAIGSVHDEATITIQISGSARMGGTIDERLSSQNTNKAEYSMSSDLSEASELEGTSVTMADPTDLPTDLKDNILSILGMGNVAIGINRERPLITDSVDIGNLPLSSPIGGLETELMPANSPFNAPEPMPESSPSPFSTPEPMPESLSSSSMAPEPIPESSPNSSMAPEPMPENAPYSSMAHEPMPESLSSSSMAPEPMPESSPHLSMAPEPIPESSPYTSMAPEPMPESSPYSSMAPEPMPESSPYSSMAPEPMPESSPYSSMAPEPMPESSFAMAPEPMSESSSSMIPEPVPESIPSSTMVPEPMSVNSGPRLLPYPHNIPDPDGIHEICDKMDSPDLFQLDAFIAIGELAVDMSSSLPDGWHISAFSPHDSPDTMLAKTFIMNFVIGANILLQTKDFKLDVLMEDTNFMDCLLNYFTQLEELLSQFSYLEMPQIGGNPIEVEYDLELEQDPSEFAGTFASDLDLTEGDFDGHQVHWCSSLMTSSSGSISSPNYPMPYPAYTICEWAIPLNPLKSLVIKFTDFNLGQEQNCTLSMDKVIVKVIPISEQEVKDVYCGSVAPPIIISQRFSAMVTIKLISRGDVSYRGFQAVYTEVDPTQALEPGLIMFPSLEGNQVDHELPQDKQCSIVYTEPYGLFPSPELSDAYPPPGVMCEMNITVSAGQLILLNITSFTLPPPNTTIICGDPYPHVMVYDIVDGQIVDEYIYCGQKDHLAVLSSANTLLVLLNSTYSNELDFQGYYVTLDASLFDDDDSRMPLPGELHTTEPPVQQQHVSQCWDVFIEPSGNFSSPGYPSFYESNIVCTWTILADPLEYIGLKFIDFDVDNAMSNGICDIRYSYIRVSYFDNEGRIASDQLCGIDLSMNVTISYSNQMVVYFYSEQGVGTGFLAEYDAFNPDPLIDGAPVFSTSNRRIPSTDDDDEVEDWSFGSSQWKSPYDELSCGDILTISGSVITSPGYPIGYGVNVWCSWIIIAEPQQYIQLHFKTDFSVGTSSADGTCFSSLSFVEVSYVDSSGQLTSQYLCGTGVPPIATSHYNQMKVYFSSQQRGRIGFSAEIVFVDSDEADYIDPNPNENDINYFSSIYNYDSSQDGLGPSASQSIFCKQQNTDCCYQLGRHPYGSIFSPGYPHSYEQNQNCTWVIEGEQNQAISLVFTDFELDSVVESHEDCSISKTHVRVVYFDKQYLTEHLYCGHSLPKVTLSASNLIYVQFHSSDANHVSDRGFKAIYHIEARDGEGTDDVSATRSPQQMLTYEGGIFRGFFPPLNRDDVTTAVNSETGVTQSMGDEGQVDFHTSVVEILTETRPTSKSSNGMDTKPMLPQPTENLVTLTEIDLVSSANAGNDVTEPAMKPPMISVQQLDPTQMTIPLETTRTENILETVEPDEYSWTLSEVEDSDIDWDSILSSDWMSSDYEEEVLSEDPTSRDTTDVPSTIYNEPAIGNGQVTPSSASTTLRASAPHELGITESNPRLTHSFEIDGVTTELLKEITSGRDELMGQDVSRISESSVVESDTEIRSSSKLEVDGITAPHELGITESNPRLTHSFKIDGVTTEITSGRDELMGQDVSQMATMEDKNLATSSKLILEMESGSAGESTAAATTPNTDVKIVSESSVVESDTEIRSSSKLDVDGITTAYPEPVATPVIDIDGRIIDDFENPSSTESAQELTHHPQLVGEVTSVTHNTSVDPEYSGGSPINFGGRFLTFPADEIKAPAGDSPKRGRPGQDSAPPMTTQAPITSNDAFVPEKLTDHSNGNVTTEIELSGKGLPVTEDVTVVSDGTSNVTDGDETNMRVTPKGRAPVTGDDKTRLVMFICIGIGLVFIILLVLMVIYCVMTKRHNAASLDLVKERASYWQSYQAFAGHDWPVTDLQGKQVAVTEATILDVRPLGGGSTMFACKPGTPHPRRERLI